MTMTIIMYQVYCRRHFAHKNYQEFRSFTEKIAHKKNIIDASDREQNLN